MVALPQKGVDSNALAQHVLLIGSRSRTANLKFLRVAMSTKTLTSAFSPIEA
jgi:hypothetical protein